MIHIDIIELFALCKGGNFNIHIGRGSAISSAKQGKSGSIYNLVKNKSVLGRANVHAFYENPKCMFFVDY